MTADPTVDRDDPAPVSACERCRRPMSMTRQRKHAAPGTLLHHSHGICHGCYTITRSPNGSHGNRGSRIEEADPVVVERVIRGDMLQMNAAERREVVARLTARRHSATEIARRTGLSGRSVQRIRARVRDLVAA